MNCAYHIFRDANSQCSLCGKPLCAFCTSFLQPPICMDCAEEYAQKLGKKSRHHTICNLLLLLVGICLIHRSLGQVLVLIGVVSLLGGVLHFHKKYKRYAPLLRYHSIFQPLDLKSMAENIAEMHKD